MLTNTARSVKMIPIVRGASLTLAGPAVIRLNMEAGNIVEYIDRNRIVCAVVLGHKNKRVRMLTEHNREVSHSEKRLAHIADQRLDLKVGREALVEQLLATVSRRRQLQQQIGVAELWELLHTEVSWIDVQSMAQFCFDGEISGDHTSAVMRSLFDDRLYFKFDTDRFFPNSPDQVARIAAQASQEARKARIIEEGSRWIRGIMENQKVSVPPAKEEVLEILKSFHLFAKDSPHYKIGKQIVSRSGLDPKEGPFHFLVKLGVWNEDENLNLHRFGISDSFPPAVVEATEDLMRNGVQTRAETSRRDLTRLSTLTIDGQGTLDFDDAISVEPKGDGHRLWVHITDVGHFLKKDGPLDQEALGRTSSIYMPDKRIPMLPPGLTEDLCSLKEGEDRLAITIMADLSSSANVVAYDIFPSIIQVDRQLTYYDANLAVEEDPDLSMIWDIAQGLRMVRLGAGALQLVLPEINVWIGAEGQISVTQINRESSSRMMVSECMILANWLAARFFRDHGQASVFRSQLPPRDQLIGKAGGSLYQNWMQRRFLSRVVLGTNPEPHAGLGLDAYLTLTSPLRKYLDLVTQRQLRGLLGMDRLYNDEELTFITQAVKEPMSYITVLQQERTRYWILKYLEALAGKKEEALVLEKRRQRYVVLLTNYMIESSLPLNHSATLKPQDTVIVKIERVNARSDTLTLSLA